MSSVPGERIPITTAPNLRDLGGWATRRGGRVRVGQVYRSAELARLSGADLAAFAALGIRVVYDLRTAAERSSQPDQLPAGVDTQVLDILADATGAAPASLIEALHDPATAAEQLGHGKAEEMFDAAYREFLTLPSATDGYRRLFSGLVDNDRRPALFHCTTGKDRTGWAAAALLLLLGVSEDDVMRDHLLTNAELLPQLKPIFDRFAAAGGDPETLRPVLGVESGYLAASLDEMKTRYGTVERYFDVGLHIPATDQQRLREALIETG